MPEKKVMFFKVSEAELDKINAFFDRHNLNFDASIVSMLLGFIDGYTQAYEQARDDARGEEL
jgi:hypothetical protein